MSVSRFAWSLSLVAALGALSSLPALAAEGREQLHEKSYPVKPGSEVVIRAARGSIRIEGKDGAKEVVMQVRARAVRGSDEKAAELLASHEVNFRQTDRGVELETRLPKGQNWNVFGPNLEVEITVEGPRELQVDAATAGGSVDVSQIQGRVDVRTSGGSLRFTEVAGPLKGRTSGGSIKAGAIRGTVDLVTSGGSIHLENATGGDVTLTTSGGSIQASGVEGNAVLRTSGGSIRVKSSGQSLEAATSGGSVDAELASNPTGPVMLRTSGGGIVVSLPATASVNLDAATSGGSVRNDFDTPKSSDRQRNVLRGALGAGGAEVKLRTSGGGIHIRKR